MLVHLKDNFCTLCRLFYPHFDFSIHPIVQLPCLPPTSAAAYQHLCRVYYQVQVWLGNELDPENWGWVLKDNGLQPIQTLLPPAPEKLLNTIFFNCKKDCNYNCGCKKVGLFCSQVCSNCQGQSCSKVESNTTDKDAYDINEEISDPAFFLEQSIEIQQQGEEEESEEHITVEEFKDYFDDS
ncbi:hypothetical protein AVEN_80908-1 [Araneus ventricosus]|uniref:Tesmin/TSO1-like CXC domain-containing protein n=1 Tax=Araneus ventricosus TaxID=182803 RepID=A0A4Y2DN64_ARAVE|nr:hypothetical protein AVEN_80908-1 [Araneus ventricosus]